MDDFAEAVAACHGCGVVSLKRFSSSSSEEDGKGKPSDQAVQMYKRSRVRVPDLSARACLLLGVQDSATDNLTEVYSNQYHAIHNPEGKINLCTAENNLCEDLLNEKLGKLDVWKPDVQHLFHYPVPGGYARTKESLLRYFEHFLKAKVDKDNVVLAAGCTAAYDMLAFCLCDPGDKVLCAAPYYGRIINDFTERGGAEVISVPFRDSSNPKLEASEFERVYEERSEKGDHITALIIVNPQNPHGNVFTKKEIISVCDWASEHNITVVIDEIFASSVYHDEIKFESFLAFRNSVKMPDNVVWIWSFSKDLCMPGLKLAVLHCENRKLTRCLKRVELMQPCAPLVQDFVVNFLSDMDWLQRFHEENVRRLERHCNIAKEALKEMGIYCVPCTAALYLYCDFRKYLAEPTFTAEYAVWKKFCEEGVYLSPGKFFADPEPGWMRLVFSCDKNMLTEGLRRVASALKKMKKQS